MRKSTPTSRTAHDRGLYYAESSLALRCHGVLELEAGDGIHCGGVYFGIDADVRILALYEIRCGKVIGCIKAKSAGHAFRRIMKLGKLRRIHWAPLAKIRVHDGSARQYIWLYQEPGALYQEGLK